MYQPPEDNRQFNFPDFMNSLFPGGQQFGPPNQGPSGFPGGSPFGPPNQGQSGFPFPGGQPFGPPNQGQPGFPFPGGSPFGPPNQGQPGFPGFPGGQPSGPGGQPGFPGGQQPADAPTTPPPSFTPSQSQFQTKAVDPGGIRGCLYRFTYVWLRRDAFWFYPVFVGRESIAGYRWHRNRWVYYGIDLDRIQSFQCY